MKSFGKWSFLSLLLFVIILCLNSSVYGQWTSVTPPTVSERWTLSGVHFTSANEGWAVGTNVVNAGNGPGVLLHHKDGVWTSVTPPDVNRAWRLSGVHFTSANEGWAVGGWFTDGGDDGGILLHHKDGVWTSVTPPDVSNNWGLRAVHFTSASEGWAVGANEANSGPGVLLHYKDGVWTSVTSPDVSNNWFLSAVHFTSANEGWAVGGDESIFSNYRGVLLHYKDGVWTSVTPPDVNGSWRLWDVHFTSVNEGWAVGNDQTNKRGVMLHYKAGVWTCVTPPTVSESWALSGVHFTSANEGWAVGWNDRNDRKGVLFHYQDNIWTSVSAPSIGISYQLYKVNFTSPNEGWAVGNNFNGGTVLLHYVSNPHTLMVGKSGTGAGTVDATRINCGIDCTETYDYGTTVILTANPNQDSLFAGWSGGGCSGTGACEVMMYEDITITATFTLINSPPVLSPKEGTLGTQITIAGSDFGIKKGKVLIGGVATKVANDGWTPDSITCIVSKVPSIGTHEVTIKPYKADDIILSNAFTVKVPEIDSLYSYIGTGGITPITISGKFFGTKKGKVYLEYEKDGQLKKMNCKVTSWGMDNITFIVPKTSKSFLPGTYPLKVDNKVGIATAIPDFTIEP